MKILENSMKIFDPSVSVSDIETSVYNLIDSNNPGFSFLLGETSGVFEKQEDSFDFMLDDNRFIQHQKEWKHALVLPCRGDKGNKKELSIERSK